MQMAISCHKLEIKAFLTESGNVVRGFTLCSDSILVQAEVMWVRSGGEPPVA